MANSVGSRTTSDEAPSAGTHSFPRATRLAAIITIVAGVLMAVAGATTWYMVQTNLADERITVSEDSPRFAKDAVNGPFTAFQEAQMIEKHYLEATSGKTYAELDREDPVRQTAMTASFLRASLFTSVVSFGVAAMAFGLGLVLIFLGFGLYALGRSPKLSTT
jgi:uncharacterized membrane protein YraQ (UPF0718 family)